MRTKGSPRQLEYRRLLAVQRLLDGYSVEEVAEFLATDASSIRRWRRLFLRAGWNGLLAHPVPGRPPRLTCTQEKIVLRWLSWPASEFGFATDLWSASRLAQLIAEEFQVVFNPDYLGTWLRQRGYTPQRPHRVAQERDPQQIQRWLRVDWPRIKKKPLASKRRWPSWTKAGC